MSKAHQNWKKFLLKEEINDLNSLIADEVSKYDDIHPSGRPYEQEFENDKKEIVEDRHDDSEREVDDYGEALRLFIKQDKTLDKFNRSINKILVANAGDDNPDASRYINVSALKLLKKNIHNISEPMRDIAFRFQKMRTYLENRSARPRVDYQENITFFSDYDYEAVLLYERFLKYITNLSIKLFKGYSDILAPSEESKYYFKAINSIMLFTGASVSTIRDPSTYDVGKADSRLVHTLNKINIKFIAASYNLFGRIETLFTEINDIFERNPHILEGYANEYKNAKFKIYRKYDMDNFKTFTIDNDEELEDLIKQHKISAKKTNDVFSRIGDIYESSLGKVYRELVSWQNNNYFSAISLGSVSERKANYVFANGFLKHAANTSPPVFLPAGTMVFRGMSIKKKIVEKIQEQIKNGATNIVFPGRQISSWTIDVEQAQNFAAESYNYTVYSHDGADPDSYSKIILAVRATKGLYVGDYSAYPAEKEIIIGGDVVIERVVSEEIGTTIDPADDLISALATLQHGTDEYSHMASKKYVFLKGRFA